MHLPCRSSFHFPLATFCLGHYCLSSILSTCDFYFLAPLPCTIPPLCATYPCPHVDVAVLYTALLSSRYNVHCTRYTLLQPACCNQTSSRQNTQKAMQKLKPHNSIPFSAKVAAHAAFPASSQVLNPPLWQLLTFRNLERPTSSSCQHHKISLQSTAGPTSIALPRDCHYCTPVTVAPLPGSCTSIIHISALLFCSLE